LHVAFQKSLTSSSPDLAGLGLLYSSLDRTLGVALFVEIDSKLKKRWRLQFYAAGKHHGFPAHIALGTKLVGLPPFLDESYATADKTIYGCTIITTSTLKISKI